MPSTAVFCEHEQKEKICFASLRATQKFEEHEQASTRLNFATKSSKGKILRAVKNFINGPFITPSREIGKTWRKSLTRLKRASHWRVRREKKNRIFGVFPQSHSPFSAPFQTFRLTARAYLNTQKYGLFCSLYGHFLGSFSVRPEQGLTQYQRNR